MHAMKAYLPPLARFLGDFLAGVKGFHDIGEALQRRGPVQLSLGRAQAVDAELPAFALQARGVGEDAGGQHTAVGADATESTRVNEYGLGTHTGGGASGRDPGGAAAKNQYAPGHDCSLATDWTRPLSGNIPRETSYFPEQISYALPESRIERSTENCKVERDWRLT